jgi:hypothetical protein
MKARAVRPRLAAITSRQGGIFKREQALSSSYSEREFRAMTRPGGPWIRIRYGVYTERERWETSSALDRARLRDRAALLVCDEGAVLSHSSAARALDLPVDEVDDDLAHVTRLGATQSCRLESGLKHHIALLPHDEITAADGLRFTTQARTVADLAREYGYLTAVVAADAALNRGLSKDELLCYANAHAADPRAPTVTAVALDAMPGAESVLETRCRLMLNSFGIVALQLQVRFDFRTGGHAVVDMYSADLRHVFEADGRVKFESPQDPRGRPITPSQKLWDEKRREDQLRGLGLGVSRLTHPDTLPANAERVRRRVWSEVRAQQGRGTRWPRSVEA